MNITIFDTFVTIAALIGGGVVSVMDNPLTATFVFLLVLGAWELAKYLPSLLANRRENI
jgi:hypothetical protein